MIVRNILRIIFGICVFILLEVWFVTKLTLVIAEEYYVLCKPGIYVNVRQNPARKSEVIGELELGDRVETDGKEKNGYVHLIGLSFELTEGWIYKGLLIPEKPYVREFTVQTISSERVATRYYINGKRKAWVKPGRDVIVYAMGKEWSITNKGYMMTKFLPINYPTKFEE